MNFATEHDLSGTLHGLFIYPIKSCAGIAVQEARLVESGLQWDRAWMVTDPEGALRTQRELPRMVLIVPALVGDELVVNAPDMPELRLPSAVPAAGERDTRARVWRDTVSARDMGDDAATWFSRYLEVPCRLVRFNPDHRRIVDPDWTGDVEAVTQFADGFPMLVTSTASVDDLNQRLSGAGEATVDARRFRPNLLIEGIESHDEDRIDSLFIAAQDEIVELRMAKPCTRCPMPDVNPDNAEVGTQVNAMLRQYRQDPRVNDALTFGMNAITLQGEGQVLRVGQRVGANLSFD
ncbi:MOSC domain-containing protein [Diaphorobacter aerolatus]|uniref:MOSC N-terminal beta barrel domain-containing protein n=1 Tax=Diaphorobacter aerolatus TaxID=1288495 RepID=A0A7H0GHK6_9BURK|nr:MOSC N-terminal beta barrel domain-containing protein [Diaphorobacter aerolatus]QNP47772.1 MOSC N-terminal beta barrel domain-containing protein [Diaphorobacter aerolatus]